MLCSEAPRAVRKYAPWVPEPIAAVVEGALQIDRERRFPTAGAMREAMLASLPNGDALRADEIVGVQPAVRNATAPAAASASELGDGDATVALQTDRSGRRIRKDESPTPNTLTNAHLDARSPSRRSIAPIAVAVSATLLGILAVGVIRTMTPGSGVTASSTADPSGSGGGKPGPANRRANLVIFPLDAAVEIDGTRVTAQDGVVELTGVLGSVHRVRVSKDGQERSADVVLGEAGAEPPKVELTMGAVVGTAPASAPAATGGTARPGTKKTATPAGTTAPGPTKNPLIPERFE
jgi:serine/threonine-protein kinase